MITTRSRTRLTLTVALGLLLTMLGAAPTRAAPSGVSWGDPHKAGPAYTWNIGNGLARTVSAKTGQKLHVAYATDRIGSSWAKNSGPYMGIYYIRSSSGSTWTTPKRLNSSKQHAARMGVGAAGSRVYVAWVSQTRVTSFSPTAPRALYVRVNTNHGATDAWRSTVRLTSTGGRVDYPTVAASGNDAHIAYTDSVSGSIRLATSHDRGVTWTKQTVGATTAISTEGKEGFPSVSVSGLNVVVAWTADGSGTVSARRSGDGGATWSTIETLTTAAAGTVSTAARGDRVAVAWSTGLEIHGRTATTGAWGPDRLAAVALHLDVDLLYAPAVALQGTSRLAVAWAERQPSDGDNNTWLHWTESSDEGATWYDAQNVAAVRPTRERNDWPSVVWPSESKRLVLWNGWTEQSIEYRVYIRTGTGVPT